MAEAKSGDQSLAKVLVVEGVLDERTVFPPNPGPQGSDLMIDVSGVKSINSVGIGAWVSWMKSLEAQKMKLTFRGLKENLAMQFSMVQGMFPAESSITSIEIQMSCDRCGKEGKKLISFPKPLSRLKPNQLDMEKLRGTGCEKVLCAYGPTASLSKLLGFLMRA